MARKSAKPSKNAGHSGQVYVVSKSGEKSRSTYVVRKAKAREISKSLGLSQETMTKAKALLKQLERDGLISKA